MTESGEGEVEGTGGGDSRRKETTARCSSSALLSFFGEGSPNLRT